MYLMAISLLEKSMSSGEDEGEAIQAANFEEATDQGIQDFIEALYTTQERELGQIDKALDAVETADSRETAVAALARATVDINALLRHSLCDCAGRYLP